MTTVIDQPNLPLNYYGMSMSVSNLPKESYIFLGRNWNAEALFVKEIFTESDMYYLTVVDSDSNEYTVRFDKNARVQMRAL